MEQTLLRDVDAVDATVFEHEQRHWMFANMVVPELAQVPNAIADELFLFHSEDLIGPWTPHPMNPVVSDVRSARPGGHLFLRDGQLIRPSQDSAGRYGRAIVFNRIDRLTPTEYSETPIGRLAPGWACANVATHTFNADGAYEVIDAARPRLRLGRPLRGGSRG